MAVTRVRWTRGALADLVAIGRYIEQDSPQAARTVVNRVELAGNRLGEFPERGRAGRVEGTRELVIPGLPFIVVYRAALGEVELLTVVHGARQYPPQLKFASQQ
jgi:addiction module RelE/StbE family toxin